MKLKFEWDDAKTQHLLNCFKNLKIKDQCNQSNLRKEFIAAYPECKLKASTIYKYATDALKGVELPDNANPIIGFWDETKDQFLIQCAKEAHKENYELIKKGKLSGKHNAGDFLKLLFSKFKMQFPDMNEQYISSRYYKLLNEGIFTAPETKNTVSQKTYDFHLIYEMWEYGHKFSKRPLFDAVCYKCSSLINYSRENIIKTETADRVPILDFYPPTFIEIPYKKSADNYFHCSTCGNKNLLASFPLTKPQEMIVPLPEPIKGLSTERERGQVALLGLFSRTAKYKNKAFGIYEHRVGEVNGLHRDDQRYFDLFMMISKESNEEMSDAAVRRALSWLKKNNHLYQAFYSNYETLLRYYKPKEGCARAVPVFDGVEFTPMKKGETKETILGDERSGLLVPAYNIPSRGVDEPVIGASHIRDMEHAKAKFIAFTRVRYSNPYLEAMIWPYHFPFGTGGWAPTGERGRNPVIPRGGYVKWRLLMYDDRFRRDPSYQFFMLDALFKERIRYYNTTKVQTKNLVEPLTKEAIEERESSEYDPHARYGTEVPTTIPNSRNFWASKCQELLSLSEFKQRQPDLFVTLTQNDSWPELQSVVNYGISAKWECTLDKELSNVFRGSPAPVDYPVEMVLTFFRRLQEFKDRVIKNKNGPLGQVEDYWMRVEYQKRGGLHVHMVLWVMTDSLPENVISAEMPRFDDNSENAKWREHVSAFQIHACRPRCTKGWKGKSIRRCKYGFPAPLSNETELDETGIRYNYVRTEIEDQYVASYNLACLLLWGGHVNVQRVTNNGWEMYLAKYIAKSEAVHSIQITDKSDTSKVSEVSEVKRFLTTRLVSTLECATLLLNKYHVSCSREIIFLPTDIDPESRFVKRKVHRPRDPDSENIYYDTKLEKYLDRPKELSDLTYPQFFSQYYYLASKRYPRENEEIDDGEGSSEDYEPVTKRKKGTGLEDLNGRRLKKREGKLAVTRFRHYSPYGEDLERYCLTKLLQHVPVNRQTIGDLKGTGSYLEECLRRGLIDKEEEALHYLQSAAKRGFSVDRLMKIAEQLIEGNWLKQQDLRKLLDTVAPYHMEVEEALQNQIIDDAELEGTVLRSKRYLTVDEYLQKFTDSQGRAFDYITSRWRKNKNVLAMITGGAGVGKSFLLDSLVAYCRENGITLQKLATTGCAAHIIAGITIHAFLKMDTELESKIEMGTHESFFIKNVQVLFIDEVSMLEDRVLAKLNEIIQLHSEDSRVFGGKSVIMFGDPAQLPPVKKHIWTPRCFSQFDTIVLREVMRQKDDAPFVELLNRVRMGEPTDRDLQVLENHLITPKQLEELDHDNILKLVPIIKARDSINETALEKLEGETVEYRAEDVDMDDGFVSDATAEFIKRLQRQQNLLPALLKLKLGAKVMLIRNRDISHGWVNGRLAIVESMTSDYVVIRSLHDPNKKLVTHRIKQEIKIPTQSNKYYRKQFPLNLAYAVTIHKAQGLSLDQAIISAKGLLTSGQFYTAISRVKTLDQVYFTDFERESIFIDPGFKQLIQWMDKVDVLKKSFNIDKPEMPSVPYNVNIFKKKPKTSVKPKVAEEIDFSDSDEDLLNVPLPHGDAIDTDPMKGLLHEIRRIHTSLNDDQYHQQLKHLLNQNTELQEFRKSVLESNGYLFNPEKDIEDKPRCRKFYQAMLNHCTVIKTTGDGSCLFRAFSTSLFGTENMHLHIRALLCQIFNDNWAAFKSLANIFESANMKLLIHNTTLFESSHGMDGWGDSAHLKAMAMGSEREIYFYTEVLDPLDIATEEKGLLENMRKGNITHGHLRYSPLHQNNKQPIMVLLTDPGVADGSAAHYSAVLKRRLSSNTLRPYHAGDVLPEPDLTRDFETITIASQ